MGDRSEGDTRQSLFPILSWKEWWTTANRHRHRHQHHGGSSPSPAEDKLARDSRSTRCFKHHHDHDRLLLLDVRSEKDFRKRHLQQSRCNRDTSFVVVQAVVVVHIPLTDLKDRLFELPPRQVPFAILMNLNNDASIEEGSNRKPNADELSGRLQQLEWALTNRSSNNSEKVQQSKRRLVCPRRITAVIAADCNETWKEAAASGLEVILTVSNMDTAEQKSETADPRERRLQPFRPEPRLWQPDPLVERILLPLLQKELTVRQPKTAVNNNNSYNTSDETLSTLPYEIWDLGSGVGRDVVFLAEELLSIASSNSTAVFSHYSPTTATPRFRVVGLDQRYRNSTDNETLSFWKRRNCQSVTACRCINLNDLEALRTELLGAPGSKAKESADILDTADTVDDGVTRQNSVRRSVRCLYAVRYWNRPLFEEVARLGRAGKLAQGTIVAISQFGKPFVGAPWKFAHPKEKHVLERNELSDLFTSATDSGSSSPWEVLHDTVTLDSDHGRTLIQFVARLHNDGGST